jgi:hypothetical protein
VLDPTRRLDLPAIPQAQVYHDHETPQLYYVVPSIPKLEVDERGAALRLIVYLKRDGDAKAASGGQLTLTTALELSAQELNNVKNAIEAGRGKTASGSEMDSSGIRLAGPDWVSGQVEVVLAESLTVSGQPALFASNRCVLTSNLDAAQVQTLRDQASSGFPAGWIAYQMVMRAATTSNDARRETTQATLRGPDTLAEISRSLQANLRAVAAVEQPITLEGPLWREGLHAVITEIELP